MMPFRSSNSVIGAAVFFLCWAATSAVATDGRLATPPQPLVAAPIAPPAKASGSNEQRSPSADAHPSSDAKAVPAESRTEQEATARAADPKDSSGALIVPPPDATAPRR
jgi:hypothetical protein